jgi:hypothetical protein
VETDPARAEQASVVASPHFAKARQLRRTGQKTGVLVRQLGGALLSQFQPERRLTPWGL